MNNICEFKLPNGSAVSTSDNVDITSRTITSVIIMNRGRIKDAREYMLDDAFAKALMRSASRHKNGVISNFGHNWNNLGKRLGRFSNFKDDGTSIRADLSIYESADESPGLPGLGSYVLNLAQEDPEVIMSSIRFSYKYQYQLSSDGAEKKVNYWDEKSQRWIDPVEADGPVLLKFDELISVDLVDEGAATDSLFSTEDRWKETVRRVLSSPEIEQHLATEEWPVLDAFYKNKITQKVSIIDQLKALIGLGNAEENFETEKTENVENNESKEVVQPATTEQVAMSAQITEEFTKMMSAQQDLLAKLTEQVEALSARVSNVENSPAADHAVGDEEVSAQKELKAYEKNPINRKWLSRRS